MGEVEIVDESGEVVESPNTETGWVEDICTVNDDGTLTVIKRMYHSYTDEELAQIAEKDKQDALMDQVAEFFPDGKAQMEQGIKDAALGAEALMQLQALASIQVMSMNLAPCNATQVVSFRDYWPEWQPDTDYKQNDCITYDGKYWRVSQDLTSQKIYPPGTSESLYYEIELADDGIIVYRTCHGDYDAVDKGEKRHYPNANSPVYESLVDNNACAPDVAPQNWKEVRSDATS